jgi:hypothetical protein
MNKENVIVDRNAPALSTVSKVRIVVHEVLLPVSNSRFMIIGKQWKEQCIWQAA